MNSPVLKLINIQTIASQFHSASSFFIKVIKKGLFVDKEGTFETKWITYATINTYQVDRNFFLPA